VPGQLRDQERPRASRLSREYRSTDGTFTDTVPRGGNAGGAGNPGGVKCKEWQTDPNAYIYFTIQERTGNGHVRPSASRSGSMTRRQHRQARESQHLRHLRRHREWLADKTKYEAVDILRTFEVPCAPCFT